MTRPFISSVWNVFKTKKVAHKICFNDHNYLPPPHNNVPNLLTLEVLQVINPLVIFVLPIVGGIAALLTGVDALRFFLVGAGTAITFIPGFNALSTIYAIKSYRRCVVTLWKTMVPIQPTNESNIFTSQSATTAAAALSR